MNNSINISDEIKYSSFKDTKENEHFFQIDLIKTIAIFFVIAIHGCFEWPQTELSINYSNALVFIHPTQIFFIIMGFNYALSFKKKGVKILKEFYNKKYCIGKIKRFIFPLLLVDFLLLVIDGITLLMNGISWSGSIYANEGQIYWSDTTWTYKYGFFMVIGGLLWPGPGTYFITIIMQFILIFPLFYYIFRKSPFLGLIVGYGIELLFQIYSPSIAIFKTYPYLFDASIFRYFSSITLGMWFSENYELFSNQNLFVWFGSLVSLWFIMNYYGSGLMIFYGGERNWWGAQNLVASFLPGLVFLLGMNILPSQINKNKARGILSISNISYHILLVQTAYFFIFVDRSFITQIIMSPSNPTFYYLSKILVSLVDFTIIAILSSILYFIDKSLKSYFNRKTYTQNEI